MADALHEIAVRGDHIGAVIDEIVAVFGVQHALGHGHADRGGDALSERAGGGLDARRHEVFRVARRLGIELAEILQLIDRHPLHAGQVQQRVEQHGAVAGRENEAVAIGPGRLGGVVFQKLREQHRRHVGRAHRQARMAGLRLLDGIHGENANGIRHVRVCDAVGGGRIWHGW